jgi:hypothetical protein
MISTMAKLTAFDVADPIRPWGKIHDFLVEFPTGRCRYFSVDAHVGVGVKEIWAPLETVARVDAEHMAVMVQTEIDREMVRHLSKLETPSKDEDEIILHRLYHTHPSWVAIRHKDSAFLRKHSRLIRGSDLIGFEVMTQAGVRGRVRDLLFDDQSLDLRMLRLQFDSTGHAVYLDLDAAQNCRVFPEAHAVTVTVN